MTNPVKEQMDAWKQKPHTVAMTGEELLNLGTLIEGLQHYIDNVMPLRSKHRDEWVIRLAEARKLIQNAQTKTIGDFIKANA